MFNLSVLKPLDKQIDELNLKLQLIQKKTKQIQFQTARNSKSYAKKQTKNVWKRIHW